MKDNFILLITFVLLFMVILAISIIVRKNTAANYDERQQLLRGKAFKYAFIVLLAYFAFSELASILLEKSWCTHETNLGLGLCFSVTVFAGVCIFSDSYVGYNQSQKGTWIPIVLIGLLNVSIGIDKTIEDHIMLIDNGSLNLSLNLIIGIAFLIIITLRGIKQIMVSKEDE